jgi:hypothetical protein
MELKCLTDKKNKAYIVPTNEWLKPIEPLITELSDANIILARLIDMEKVLVRLTNNSSNKLKIISSNLSTIPNFPSIYCVIICNEKSEILDAMYNINGTPAKGFCNGKSTDGKITLEIMKYYKKNHINKFYEKKIDIKYVKSFLDQALSAQLLAFEKFGFLHNDIHRGNIIINKEDYEYNYNFKSMSAIVNFYKNITGKNNYKVYLIDFGKSEFMLPEYRSQYIEDYYDEKSKNDFKTPKREYREKFDTLPQNIYTTFMTFLELSNNYNKYAKILQEHVTNDNPTLDYYNYLFFKSQSSLFYSRDTTMFIKKNIESAITMINKYYKALSYDYYMELKD